MLPESQPTKPSSCAVSVSFGPISDDPTSRQFSQILFDIQGQQSEVSPNSNSINADRPIDLQDACSKINKLLINNKIYKEAFEEANAKIHQLNQTIANMKEKKNATSQLEQLHMSGIAQAYDSSEDSMFMGNLMQAKYGVKIQCADCSEKERRVEIFKTTIEDLQKTVDMLRNQLKKAKEAGNSKEDLRGAPKLVPICNQQEKEPNFNKKSADPMRQQRARLPESEERAAYQRLIKPISGMQQLKEDFSRIPLKAGKIRAMSACAAWLHREISEL